MQNKLVFFGHGGSYNHGCEAIIRSTLDMLAELSGKAPEAELFTSDPASDRDFGVDRLVTLREQRNPFRVTNPGDDFAMLMRKVFRSDKFYLDRFFKGKMDGVSDSLCLSVGGDMYCYGRLPWLYYIHDALKENGNRTLLWGCSVNRSSFFKEAEEDLRRYDRILVRESVSAGLFQEHGFTNIDCYPDPAFTLRAQEARIPGPFVGENTVAVNLSPLMKRYRGDAPLSENVETLLQHILEDTDLDVLLLPHVNGWTDQENDHEYLRGFFDEFADSGRVRLLGRGYNCCELKYIISQCRFLMTARTHAGIAGYSTGVPTVVFGYSTKARGIARDIFGTEQGYVVPVQKMSGINTLADSFDWLAAQENHIRRHLADVMPDYIAGAFGAGKEILELLKVSAD